MMKQLSYARQKRIAISDEKIFALSETNKGGYWHPRNESPPSIREWQADIKWHVWGARDLIFGAFAAPGMLVLANGGHLGPWEGQHRVSRPQKKTCETSSGAI